jgi:hypothetical protein
MDVENESKNLFSKGYIYILSRFFEKIDFELVKIKNSPSVGELLSSQNRSYWS